MDMDEVLEASKNLPGVSSAHLKTGSQSARMIYLAILTYILFGC